MQQGSLLITQVMELVHFEQLRDVQAHVFAAVMDNPQVDSSAPSGQQQRDVLATALTSAVWQVTHVLPPAVTKLPLYACT